MTIKIKTVCPSGLRIVKVTGENKGRIKMPLFSVPH
jgi:hypothetical protein